ncbi:MAG: sulfotransferase domain-containing protein [Pseudomonadota bacterium]
MSLPDFLIIGAMKCGTSTLQAQLKAQSGVFMTDPKEPNFFSDDDVYAKGLDWYRGLYGDAPEGALKGEASTHYTKLPTYPDCVSRMRKDLDRPKLVYLVRNPVERLISHYLHLWSMREAPDDFETALSSDPTLVAYSQYSMQIEPFVNWVGSQNIFLTSLERLKSRRSGELADIGEFLGIDTAWVDASERMNASADRARAIPLQGLILDNPVAAGLRRALVPKSLRTAIRNRLIRQEPELATETRSRLQALFAPDFAKLQKMFPDSSRYEAAYAFR